MSTRTIETRLLASIQRLGEHNYCNAPQGYQFEVYLDPEGVELYTHEGVGNIGVPMAAFHGRHVYILDIPQEAIAESVVEVVSSLVDYLVAIVEDYDGDEWDGNNFRGRWKTKDYEDDNPRAALGHIQLGEIACYWDPYAWFELAGDQIADLAEQDKTAAEIVDELGTGDDYSGRVDRDAAIEYVTERLGEVGRGGRCADCGTKAEERACVDCGVETWVIDCGHHGQPAEISAGRDDGTDPDHWYCDDCGRTAA